MNDDRLEDIDQLIPSFKIYLRARGMSKRYTYMCSHTAGELAGWLRGQQLQPSLSVVDRNTAYAWVADMRDLYSTNTVSTKLDGIRAFAKWAVEEGYEIDPVLTTIRTPRVVPDVPILQDHEVDAILSVCGPGRDLLALRDNAMVTLLVDCGMRGGELLGMRVVDLDLGRGEGSVLGKGNKRRKIYPTDRALLAVDRYLRKRRRQKRHGQASDPRMWLGRWGTQYYAASFNRRLHDIGEAAGVPDLHPHRFRHTFAHRFLLAGGQERDLKRLMGWSSDAMLERYGRSAADVRAGEAARRFVR